MPIAIYNRLSNQVRTLIREDHGGYHPPAGWELVRVADLPSGWTMEPAEPPAADADLATRIAEARRIVDAPREPIELATWASMQEVIEELRAAKAGKPKPGRSDSELREAVKARLETLKQVRP